MAEKKYAVVRTDLMYGTDDRSGLVSVKYMGNDGNTPTEIENGNVLKVKTLIEGEREIFKGEEVSSTDKLENIVLIAAPETMYDERKKNLDEFINEADVAVRGYRLHNGNIFSVTKEALVGEATPAVGDIVELGSGTKLSVVKSASGATVVGKIIEVEITGRYTYYVILVDENA